MLPIHGSTRAGTKTSGDIRSAIEALEDHRSSLGDEIVDTAVTPLKERLALLHEHEAAAKLHRKFVSVMFMDLTNYTTLLRQMKQEEMLVFRDSVMSTFKHIIEMRGGRVLQFMGDGLFAVFGIPDVREDDAERAIRAGLDLLSEAIIFEQQVRRKWNLEGFGVRVGVDSGPVIVGGGIEAELTALGMTVNLAARMEQTAPAGSGRFGFDAGLEPRRKAPGHCSGADTARG